MCADSNSTLFESGKQPEAPINSATELSFNPYELDAGRAALDAGPGEGE